MNESLNFALMIGINALVCILLPRIITLKWSEILSNLIYKTNKNQLNKTVLIEES